MNCLYFFLAYIWLRLFCISYLISHIIKYVLYNIVHHMMRYIISATVPELAEAHVRVRSNDKASFLQLPNLQTFKTFILPQPPFEASFRSLLPHPHPPSSKILIGDHQPDSLRPVGISCKAPTPPGAPRQPPQPPRSSFQPPISSFKIPLKF